MAFGRRVDIYGLETSTLEQHLVAADDSVGYGVVVAYAPVKL